MNENDVIKLIKESLKQEKSAHEQIETIKEHFKIIKKKSPGLVLLVKQ